MPRLMSRFGGWRGPITKAGLDRLRDQLSKPERVLDLTIGGSTEESVHVDIDTHKRTALRFGERTLSRASDTVQRDHRLAALHGLSKQQLRKAVHEREHKPKVRSANRSRTVTRDPNR